MGELKLNKKADKIGYLYRAALYLAQGDSETGLFFLEKSKDVIGSMRTLYKKIWKYRQDRRLDNRQKRIFAEKILDEYKRQMFLLR